MELHRRRASASWFYFICGPDGIHFACLGSFKQKHNEANLDENRDGESHNRSWNCGVEGPTDDAEVLALRARQKRNFLTTLFLSQGVPMLLAGDELGRTQHGNNNAHCQDNELSWVDWELLDKNEDLVDLVAWLTQLRRDHPVFQRRGWFHGAAIHGSDVSDIAWFTPDGKTMRESDW